MAGRVIVVTNQKGGVGKTTTAVSLAHGLAIQGAQVLLVDLDPQGHLATVLGLEQRPGVYDWIVRERPLRECVLATGRERLALLPGNKRTASTITYLVVEHGGRVPADLLTAQLRPAFRNGLDYCIVDTAPSASELQAAALHAADLVVIPAACEFLSAEACADVLETIALVGGREYMILPTMYQERVTASEAALAEYNQAQPGRVLEPVHMATRFRDAVSAGKTIFELESNGRPAQEYARLVWWVRDHV